MCDNTDGATNNERERTDCGTESLVDRAREGDEDAWCDLYRASYRRLLAFAHHRLGSLDEARDAVSETMARAVAQLDRYRRDDEGFTAWLFGILRHVVADVYRSRRRAERRQLPEEVPGPDPAEALLIAADQRILREAFGRLGPAEQELLSLRVVGGLSSEQVAEALGCSAGSVRMAQMRALARLRTFVEGGQRV